MLAYGEIFSEIILEPNWYVRAGLQPGVGQPDICPPKFSKSVLVFRCNNTLQQFWHPALTEYIRWLQSCVKV